VDRADQIRFELKNHDDFNEAIEEAKAIFESVKNDPDVKSFNDKAAKFFGHFTYTDAKGNRQFNRDLVNELRTFVVPMLMKQLEHIPIPPIEDRNENFDSRIENITLSGYDIIPDHVKFYMDSEFDFNVNKLEAEKGCTTALLKITNMRTKIPGIKYWINKKSFPSIEDHGIANVTIGGRGADLRVYLQIENLFGSEPTFTFSKVKFTIDTFTIDIIKTEHTIITPILTSLWKNQIKRTIEEQVEKRITDTAKNMEEGLNNMMAKYSPSQLADIAAGKISEAGNTFLSKAQELKENITAGTTQQGSSGLKSA
jgi:hypothetical protein